MISSTPATSSHINDRASLLARIAALELENKLLREALAQPSSPSVVADAQDALGDLSAKNNGIYFDGFRTRLNTAEDCAATVVTGESSIPLETKYTTDEIADDFGPIPVKVSRSRSADVCPGECSSQVYFPLGDRKINRFLSLQAIDIDSSEDDFVPPEWDVDQEDETKKSISRSRSVVEPSKKYKVEPIRERRRLSDHELRQNNATSRAVELFMSLNSLNKMLSTETMRSFDDSSEPRQSFQQFFLFSVDPNIARKDSDWVHSGTAFLDPIVLRRANCIDCYPRGIRSGMSTDELSMFCLLGGLKIWLIPSAAGSVGVACLKKSHDYKVLAFTDMNGMTNHGVAITVLEEIDATQSGYESFVNEVQTQQQRRLATRKIALWWRTLLNKKVNIEAPTSKGSNRSSQGSEVKKQLKSSFGPKLKKILGIMSDSDASRITRQRKEKQDLSKSFKQTHDLDLSKNCDKANKRGNESFHPKEKARASEVTCLVEKCYVMIGGKQSEQFLQFRSLRHLIEMESKKGGKDEAVSYMNDENNQTDYTIVNQEALRHKFLSVVQTRMCLNPIQARVTHPDNAFEIIATSESMPTFDINLPAFNWVDRMSIHLPLPQVARHWGLSVLFERLRPSFLLAILRLLLIERSILIIGENSIVVSSCTCALVDLLRPYKWASTFMPLLPESMLDFVHSPVPFITGLVVKDKANSNRVENDHRVVEALSNGLSIVNLISGTVLITNEPGIKSMIQKCPAETTKLSMYRTRLKTLRDSSPGSFAAFIDSGVSPKEVVTLSAVQRVLFDYMKFFAGDIGSTPDGWQRYGIHLGGEDDSDMGDFAFYPSLFVRPLREKMESQLHLQQMMAHSQLFIEYVSEKRRTWKSRQDMARGEIGQFIATWIFERWRQRKF